MPTSPISRRWRTSPCWRCATRSGTPRPRAPHGPPAATRAAWCRPSRPRRRSGRPSSSTTPSTGRGGWRCRCFARTRATSPASRATSWWSSSTAADPALRAPAAPVQEPDGGRGHQDAATRARHGRGLGRSRDEHFTDADGEALLPFAKLVGLLLRNARRLAEARQTGQTRSQFMTLAAHELRTPLAVIRGYLSLLEDG